MLIKKRKNNNYCKRFTDDILLLTHLIVYFTCVIGTSLNNLMDIIDLSWEYQLYT